MDIGENQTSVVKAAGLGGMLGIGHCSLPECRVRTLVFRVATGTVGFFTLLWPLANEFCGQCDVRIYRCGRVFLTLGL